VSDTLHLLGARRRDQHRPNCDDTPGSALGSIRTRSGRTHTSGSTRRLRHATWHRPYSPRHAGSRGEDFGGHCQVVGVWWWDGLPVDLREGPPDGRRVLVAVQGPSLPGGDHQPLCVAVLPIPAQFPRGRGDDAGARLDRLARALTVQEAALAVAWRAGGRVFTADAGEVLQDDPDDPMRTALRQVVGVFAELDRRMVVKRLRDGRKAKAADGRKATGAYPYGYAGAGKGRTRDAAPDPKEQRAVALIAELRGAGRSYREIAAELDAAGLPPRRAAQWSAMAVRNIAARAGRQ
jgi:hypothetical protein